MAPALTWVLQTNVLMTGSSGAPGMDSARPAAAMMVGTNHSCIAVPRRVCGWWVMQGAHA
jgi:hypothetical protein